MQIYQLTWEYKANIFQIAYNFVLIDKEKN